MAENTLNQNTINKHRKKIRKYSKFDRKNFPFVYCLIFIPVVQFLIFWVFINIQSIALAFQNTVTGTFSLDNFIDVFKNLFSDFQTENSMMLMLGRSVLLWCISNIITFPIGLASTYVLYRRVVGHYVYRVIFTIPGIIGAVAWVTMIKSICNPTGFGAVIYILQNWFHVDLPQKVLVHGLFGSSITAFPTLIIISILTGIVGGSVIATGAYAKIPPELMEASKLDGLDFWGSFFNVALPCSWPTISTLLTIALCGILVADANVYLYTNGNGGNGMNTMGYYLYSLTVKISKANNPNDSLYGYASAVGVTISAISIPIVLLGRRIINKVIPPVEV